MILTLSIPRGIREQLEDYFYQALEVELLLRLCPDEEDTIYQIVDLLVGRLFHQTQDVADRRG